MTTPLQTSAARYFQEQLGVHWDRLLAPISASQPSGQPVRSSGVYSAINQARRQDDASVPMGAWEYELKRADWAQVSTLALDALQQQSKDMQLVAWLLEAQINQRGLGGISAPLVLLDSLCASYWDTLYPLAEDGAHEHRANIIGWIGEKLLVPLRLAPLIGIGRERQYSWADWEQAHRNEQLKTSKGNKNPVVLEGIGLQELSNAINGADTGSFQAMQQILSEALQAILQLTQTLDPLFGDEAPGMGSMDMLLQQMLALVEGELHKRGVRPLPAGAQADSTQSVQAAPAAPLALPHAGAYEIAIAAPETQASTAIRNRADAYARLAETAEFLMRLEPHSPVPYLVRRATEWGSLNTVELYQELFLKLNGQLNIFEMLGLAAAETAGQ
jgi:type VI secretion system protein ImpA